MDAPKKIPGHVLYAGLCLISLAADILLLVICPNTLRIFFIFYIGTNLPLMIVYDKSMRHVEFKRMEKLKNFILYYTAVLVSFLIFGMGLDLSRQEPKVLNPMDVYFLGVAQIPYIALHFYGSCILKENEN